MPNNHQPAPLTDQDKIDVLDEQGNKTGEVLSRKEIHQLGKIHRAVHLYLFDISNNLLLQRRSYKVDHYPGMWSISVTGHVDAGEISQEAVIRELQEELGIDADAVKIDFLFSLRQDAYLGPSYIDRQFNDIYVGWADFKIEAIVFDSQVVSEIKLVPFSEFEAMVTNQNGELAPVYQEAASHLLHLLNNRSKLP
jgi:isopentenyl-diphosphate delta-isomerase type 1